MNRNKKDSRGLPVLEEFTGEEYARLKNTGFLWEFYPHATGSYIDDCIKKRDDYKKEYINE